MDERPHPPGLDVLVDGVYGDEASGVGPFVATSILDDLDVLRGELDAVFALDLARGDDPDFGVELVEEPASAPHRDGNVSGAVVELGREAGGASPNRPADGTGRDDRTEYRSPLPDAQFGDLLDVREI